MEKIEIIPFQGINGIRFGESLDQTLLLLGRPSKISNELYEDGTNSIIHHYSELDIDLFFDSEDEYLLGNITIGDNRATLFGEKFLGLNEKEFIEKIEELQLGEVLLDDDLKELKSKNYVIDELGLSFWFVNSKLKYIGLMPEFNSETNLPVWPNNGS